MEEELKELEATIESLYCHIEQCGSKFNKEVAWRMLEAFEEYEITIGTNLKPEQYVDFLVLYYITDNWGNPAKFLWKRIPDVMKKDKDLRATWDIGKLLYTSNFFEAVGKINDFGSGKLSSWLKSGYKYYMHQLINKMYAVIDDATFRALMGLKDAKEHKEYLAYYEAEVKPNEEDTSSENVEINESHLQTLKLLAQFIEKDSATKIEKEA
mmetsp:Transcript_42964/g.50390  ORF Transcript_42964/g.50390 Transcript_42964/m.50390 type:complete len:211 (-) Transcript_42964:36-668(-)